MCCGMLEREQCCDLEIIRTARTVGEQPFVQMFSASFAVASYRPALTASEQTHRSGSKKTAGAESLFRARWVLSCQISANQPPNGSATPARPNTTGVLVCEAA
jgi:hypothetical protein